jgi:predicted membrane protein
MSRTPNDVSGVSIVADLMAMIKRSNVGVSLENDVHYGSEGISAYALFGQVTIRVPDDAGIHLDGSAIMGQTGYEWRSEDNELHSPVGLPEIEFETVPVRLRITAVAMFGEVKIVRVVTGERTAPALSVEPLPEVSSNAGSYEGETRRIASL